MVNATSSAWEGADREVRAPAEATAESAATLPSASALPVARFAKAVVATSTYYVVTAIDARGRIADRSALRVLGWSAGKTYAIRLSGGLLITVTRAPGLLTVTGQGHLRLPLAVRRLYRIEPGERLLVAAYPDSDALIVCRTAVLDVVLHRHLVSIPG